MQSIFSFFFAKACVRNHLLHRFNKIKYKKKRRRKECVCWQMTQCSDSKVEKKEKKTVSSISKLWQSAQWLHCIWYANFVAFAILYMCVCVFVPLSMLIVRLRKNLLWIFFFIFIRNTNHDIDDIKWTTNIFE